MTHYVTVAKVGDITAGEGATFNVEGHMVAVFNTADGYYAIDDFCPHMGASLACGPVEDGEVSGPWHAWRFSLDDGTWSDSPNIKVGCFDVRIEGDDIQVQAPEKKASEPS